MLDHVKVFVSDYGRSRAFYVRALAPLGYRVLIEREPAEAGLGAEFPSFWVEQRGGDGPGTAVHLAFRAPDRETVDRFHAAALAGGGTDNGPPGLRDYHPTYYGAFVLDPDGNNVEAVFHGGHAG